MNNNPLPSAPPLGEDTGREDASYARGATSLYPPIALATPFAATSPACDVVSSVQLASDAKSLVNQIAAKFEISAAFAEKLTQLVHDNVQVGIIVDDSASMNNIIDDEWTRADGVFDKTRWKEAHNVCRTAAAILLHLRPHRVLPVCFLNRLPLYLSVSPFSPPPALVPPSSSPVLDSQQQQQWREQQATGAKSWCAYPGATTFFSSPVYTSSAPFTSRPLSTPVRACASVSEALGELDRYFASDPEGWTPIELAYASLLTHWKTADFTATAKTTTTSSATATATAATDKSAKKYITLIITDGLPTNPVTREQDLSGFEAFLRRVRVPPAQFPITFALCTQDDLVVQFFNRLDEQLVALDVMTDFNSERTQVLQTQGPQSSYSYGDHIVKLLLGSSDADLDLLDERRIRRRNAYDANDSSVADCCNCVIL